MGIIMGKWLYPMIVDGISHDCRWLNQHQTSQALVDASGIHRDHRSRWAALHSLADTAGRIGTDALRLGFEVNDVRITSIASCK
jgi:hypothetical protein